MVEQPFISQPSIYHGDEIEVEGGESTWTTKKTLRVVKHLGFFNWKWIFFFVELKVDNPDVLSYAGIFVDEADEPVFEIPVSAIEYGLFERDIDMRNWEIGTHLIELKLKSEGTTIHNRLFEIWVG